MHIPWVSRTDRVAYERMAGKATAEEAAIRDEFPRFNTTYNKQRHPFQEIQRTRD
jgi:hypothetical protein